MKTYLCDGASGKTDICEYIYGCHACKQVDDDRSVFDRYMCTDARACVRDKEMNEVRELKPCPFLRRRSKADV